MSRKFIILFSLLFVLVNSWIAYDKNAMPDRVRTLNISQIMAGSTVGNFPVWGDVSGDIKLNLVTKISNFNKVTVAPLGENVTFYYIPIIGKSLGLYYPYLSILIFYCLLIFLVNYLALNYSNHLSNIAYIFLANAFLIYFLLFFEFGIVNVYYAKGLAIFLSFSLFKIFENEQKIVPAIITSIIFAILSNIRHSIGAVYFLCVFLILILNYRNISKLKIFWLVLIFYSTKYIFGAVIITNPSYLNFSQPIDHVFWHTIWCSIGAYDPENVYGFKWSDAEASQFAANYAGHNVIFSSLEYEALLRKYILEIFSKDPKFILGYFANRLFQNWFFYIALGLNLLALFTKRVQISSYFIIFLSLLPISVFKAEEILSISSIAYVFPVNIYTQLIFTMVFIYLINIFVKKFIVRFKTND